MKSLILNRLKYLQEQKKDTEFWNITWLQGVYLSNLVQIKKPNNILEIGTSNGFSTLWLVKNLPEGSKIDTIDVNDERLNLAKRNFEFCNLSTIDVHFGEVFEVIPKLRQKKYDLVFIDAAHRFYREIMQELENNNMLNSKYVVIFDNILSHKYMSEFIEEMQERYYCEVIELGGGLLVVSSGN